jgi:hypothetical protein
MSRLSRPPLTDTARAAYAAYGAVTGHRTHDDRPMPAWDDLGEHIQAAWTCAAGSVALETLAQLGSRCDGPPDIGDVVLVPVDRAVNINADVAPAVITRVWNGTTVNVRVLTDGDAIAWRTSLVYTDSLANVSGPACLWTWPGGE